MLVLARKSNETIRIGDQITVKVISIRNGQVKLGIEAPRELKVTRDGKRHEDGTAGAPRGAEAGATNAPSSTETGTAQRTEET